MANLSTEARLSLQIVKINGSHLCIFTAFKLTFGTTFHSKPSLVIVPIETAFEGNYLAANDSHACIFTASYKMPTANIHM
jgi:hypothetical protein